VPALYGPWHAAGGRRPLPLSKGIWTIEIASITLTQPESKEKFPTQIFVFPLNFQLKKPPFQFTSDLRFALTASPYLTYSESCCTQALLFRCSSLPSILNELSVIKTDVHYAKDHLIDQSRFVGRMTDRNLFVHVGHFSAVSWGFVDVYF
jgi:hypothetical protein